MFREFWGVLGRSVCGVIFYLVVFLGFVSSSRFRSIWLRIVMMRRRLARVEFEDECFGLEIFRVLGLGFLLR